MLEILNLMVDQSLGKLGEKSLIKFRSMCQSELCSINTLFLAFFDSICLNVLEKYCIIRLQILILRKSSNVLFLDLYELQRAN